MAGFRFGAVKGEREMGDAIAGLCVERRDAGKTRKEQGRGEGGRGEEMGLGDPADRTATLDYRQKRRGGRIRNGTHRETVYSKASARARTSLVRWCTARSLTGLEPKWLEPKWLRMVMMMMML